MLAGWHDAGLTDLFAASPVRLPDNVSVSLFLANPETDVLPIRMWSMLESTLDVRTAAVSGVLIATTALFVFVMDRVAGLTRRLT